MAFIIKDESDIKKNNLKGDNIMKKSSSSEGKVTKKLVPTDTKNVMKVLSFIQAHFRQGNTICAYCTDSETLFGDPDVILSESDIEYIRQTLLNAGLESVLFTFSPAHDDIMNEIFDIDSIYALNRWYIFTGFFKDLDAYNNMINFNFNIPNEKCDVEEKKDESFGSTELNFDDGISDIELEEIVNAFPDASESYSRCMCNNEINTLLGIYKIEIDRAVEKSKTGTIIKVDSTLASPAAFKRCSTIMVSKGYKINVKKDSGIVIVSLSWK